MVGLHRDCSGATHAMLWNIEIFWEKWKVTKRERKKYFEWIKRRWNRKIEKQREEITLKQNVIMALNAENFSAICCFSSNIFFPSLLVETRVRVWKNDRERESRVTRWLDNFSIFGLLLQGKFGKRHEIFATVGSQFCNKYLLRKRFLPFCQSGRISPNPVTLRE